MTLRLAGQRRVAIVALPLAALLAGAMPARSQKVEDGSDAAIGPAAARTVLDLIKQRFGSLDPKVSVLRKAKGAWICGSVNVKNREGLYSGERGFVADLSNGFFGRVPDGPEMLSSRSEGFEERERVRQLYFDLCLD
ncbi:hypothetical protein GGR33_002369 [Methylobacterium brachythecii]|uniref:Uncharacterized protein n=1 Tax=Methylobacterium brachythecii TaxID=1176177 RepID=A0A7W6ANG5_9HYPH|nr:hypothetical protein [Methylobacterium brachythecii]MBB3902867.1 hypothetical protein [Methylobacterium brachythecii]